MCQIDVCTCTRLFETMPGVQPPSRARPLPFLRPTTPVAPCSSTRLPPSLPCHTNPYRYLYALPPTTHIARLFPRPPPRPPPPPVTHSSQLCEHGVTASTIRNAHHHPLLSPITYAVLPSLTYLSLSLSVSTSVFLKRPIQSTRRVRPYGAVSTGTPARSLKENAIIRRTSTNELIVGASRYRQYREVLYSTSPGATRL